MAKQAVILAAGASTRTYPLTVNKPKPLLKIANKTILEHNLEQLDGLVEEAIIVIGFQGEQIIKKIGEQFSHINIRYVQQSPQLGTAHALLQAKALINEEFILLNGDDLYSREDIKKCIEHKYAILASKVNDFQSFGMLELKEENKLSKIIEKPSQYISNLANTGLYVLDSSIFNYIAKVKKTGEELFLTDAVNLMAEKEHVIVVPVSNYWLPIAYPWNLLDANEFLLKRISLEIDGVIEQNVTLKGPVGVGKNSIVKNGTYIEGPVIIGANCHIGPNAYIRGATAIGDSCKIGNAVEIKSSIIMNSATIGHLSYVGDSVIGEHVNLGAGTIVANLRHDGEEVKSIVKGNLISIRRRKFGTVIGDNAKTGIHTSIYPGRKIWPNKTTLPGEIVKKDID
jgi:bifunctional UDP-N-acetylglucosamine pyrophosphorylase/glucosamine-1-phosphate N-acetyltransferase